MAKTKGAFGLDSALAIWRRRGWLGIVAFVIPVAGVFGLVPFLPNVYRASAVILVDRQQVPEAFVKSTVTSALETRLQAISQEILSRVRLEKLIVQFGLYSELRGGLPLEAVVEGMRGDIQLDLRGARRAGQDEKIVAFSVSYLGSDPRTVANVVNTLASDFLEGNTRVRGREASGTAEFLRRQLEDVKKRLEEQEQRLSAFKARYLGETPQHIQENLTMLERLNTQLRLNSERQARAMGRREALARQIADAEAVANLAIDSGVVAHVPSVTAPVDPAYARLGRLKQELAELRTRFSDKYPDVVRLKADIAELEKLVGETSSVADEQPEAKARTVARRRATSPSPYGLQLKETIVEIEAELKALRVEEKRLNDDLTLYQRRVENTPRREQEFQTLSRDYGTIGDLYRTLLQRYEEAQLAETLEQRQKGEQFRILEAAIPPAAPFSPNRFRLILGGLILSLGLAAGAVMLAEQLDSSFHAVDDLQAFTAVPVLISIPRIATRADLKRRRWRVALAGGASVAAAGAVACAGYIVASGYVPVASRVVHGWLLRN